jgi:mycothiol maleylpyruvate isomerase-like protein
MAQDRVAAIAELRSAVDAFIDHVEQGPEPHLTGGEWGTREVLCHLVYWHETYVLIVRAMNTNQPPVQRAGSFKDFNREGITQLGAEPVAGMLTRLRRAQRRLEVELLALPPAATINIKVDSKPWPADEFPARIAGHIRGHLRQLRRGRRRRAA